MGLFIELESDTESLELILLPPVHMTQLSLKSCGSCVTVSESVFGGDV